MERKADRLARPDGETLAYHRRGGKQKPGLLWLGGFKSDMTGTKAQTLDAWAAERDVPFLRFDYFGHGASSGRFEDGTIGRWAADAVAALDQLTEGPQILVGSSMGGWVALLAALARPGRIAGLFLIAPAPDFTEDLMWAQFPPDVRAEIETHGRWARPSAYDPEPYVITKRLIEEGRAHRLLGGPIAIAAPVHILHGMRDDDVPWQHGLRLVEALDSTDVTVTLVKTGDHRLSDPAGIARMLALIGAFHEGCAACLSS